MPAALDALIVGLYVSIDDFLGPRHRGRGRPPKLTDAELITLAVAQVLLGMPNDRQFLALARWRLGHLFPLLIDQSGYNRRLRGLAPQIARCISYLGYISPSFCDRLRLLDSTPVPCGQSRQTTRRSEFAGHAGYGRCASHSRWFWGFRLYLICSGDGMPIGWELAAANIGERVVAAELLERIPVAGHVVIADKNFSGHEFEQLMAAHGATFLARPQKRTAPPRQPRRGPPMDRIDLLDLQGPTRPRTPRRPHAAWARRPHRSATARPRRRHLAQPPHRPTSPSLRRLRPLITHQPSRDRSGVFSTSTNSVESSSLTSRRFASSSRRRAGRA